MSEYAGQATQAFDRSRERFEQLMAGLAGAQADELTHAQLEDRLAAEGRQLLRLLLQDHLELRAVREQRRSQVAGADEVARTRVETGHDRGLATVFGPVTVTRMAYRAPGVDNLYPADAVLNLPAGTGCGGWPRWSRYGGRSRTRSPRSM